jgi:dihydroxy-acid dehydratase
MGLIRLDVPKSQSGTADRLPRGRFRDRDVTIQDVFEAGGGGENAAGRLLDEDRLEVESARPGAGSCGVQYTANTMAMVMEPIGLAIMGTGSVPATDPHESEQTAYDR